MKVINLNSMKSIVNKIEATAHEGKIHTKGRKYVDDDYVTHAFSALDAAIERTKQESLAYVRWRDGQNKDLEIKSQFMSEEELASEKIKDYRNDFENIYGILDGNIDDLTTVKADRKNAKDVPNNIKDKNYKWEGVPIKDESSIENHPLLGDNKHVQNFTPSTEIIYTIDDEEE